MDHLVQPCCLVSFLTPFTKLNKATSRSWPLNSQETATRLFFQYLVHLVQFRTRPAAVVAFFSEPLGANFDPTAAGLAAT